MSKLTFAGLFDAFQSARVPTRPEPSRRGDWVGQKLWTISSAEGTGAALIGADELAAAVHKTFGTRRDRVLGRKAPGATTRNRRLRFDELHHGGAADTGTSEDPPKRPPANAAELLTQALGMALARDTLGGNHWIVVVIDDAQRSTGPSAKLLKALASLRKLLIVCCDHGEPAATANVQSKGNDVTAGNGATLAASRPKRRSAKSLFDRLAAESGLGYVGPVGGVEVDGLLAVFEALKTIEQPTVLHLRLARTDAPGGGHAPAGLADPSRPRRAVPLAVGVAEEAVCDDLTAELRTLVESRRLSAEVQTWVRAYGAFGKRGSYLWRWAHCGVEMTTLPCVAPEWCAEVHDTKVLSIMLCVLLDDVADEHGNGNMLETLIRVVGDAASPTPADVAEQNHAYVEFTRRLAAEYDGRTRRYPGYESYAELLRYDQLQFLNTLRYSHLLNRRLNLLNLVEHDLYLPHNMHMMSFATLDLMCSPTFDDCELGTLREAIWHAQCMGRIGNLLATWRREVRQRDFTSGIFARALAQGDLTVEQLRTGQPHDIEAAIRSGRHERYFLDRWEQHQRSFATAADRIESIELGRLVAGHERFLRMHLGSKDLI